MSLYLLDTNILSDLLRRPRGFSAARVAEVGEAQVCTSIVVASELRFGAVKRGSAALTSRVEALLAAISVLPLAPPADVHYGRVRQALEERGLVIGGNDMLIAAHALAVDAILVTDNEREFERVTGLAVENWLRARR